MTWLSPVSHLLRDWAHPLPHLRHNWAHSCHIRAGTGLAPPLRHAAAPGLGSPLSRFAPPLGSPVPHLRLKEAHLCSLPPLHHWRAPIPVQICGQGRAQVPVQMWQRFRFFGRLFARACHAVACPAACCLLRVVWLPWTWCLLYGFWRLRRNRIACRMLQIARCPLTYGGTKSAPVSAWMRAHASSRAFRFGAHIVTCHVLPCPPPDQGDCEGGGVGRRASERARASVARVWL